MSEGYRSIYQSGFTLLELLIAAVILALLTLIALPHYMEYKREAMAQEAFLQLSEWGDYCILRAVRAYETTPVGERTVYPIPANEPEAGKYFRYSHNSGTVEDVILIATGFKGDLVGRTLTMHVRVNSGYPSKRFSGSLF